MPGYQEYLLRPPVNIVVVSNEHRLDAGGLSLAPSNMCEGVAFGISTYINALLARMGSPTGEGIGLRMSVGCFASLRTLAMAYPSLAMRESHGTVYFNGARADIDLTMQPQDRWGWVSGDELVNPNQLFYTSIYATVNEGLVEVDPGEFQLFGIRVEG